MWWFTSSKHHLRQTKRYNITRIRLNTESGSVVFGILLLVLVICSVVGDSLEQECGNSQYKCFCGVPQCIDKELVKNGVQDCSDGSDEGQWDPSKCAIKNTTSEDIRFKRAALTELKKVVNNGATTTYYEGDRGQTRPIGLLTTTMGSFVTSGTTTEYITKLLATYVKNTYARIQTTSSRIYHAVPTELPNGENMMIRPTGFIASTISTEVRGYATTAITTDFYRTYIDGTYAQVVSSYSNVYYPPWYTDPIVVTSSGESTDPGMIYATQTLDQESHRTTIQVVNNGKLETIVIAPIMPTKVSNLAAQQQTQVVHLPLELSGNFITKKSSDGASISNIQELGVVENENRLRALRPNNIKENEVRVTGTHGNFVHTNSMSGDKTTYNVFTGTYVQNSKTFLFFFGNTVLQPSPVDGQQQPQQTIIVENGPQKNNVIVDMSENLKVIVPATKNRATVDSSINGEVMEGVMIEIESSETELSIDGATQQTPTIDAKIDEVTLTLDKNNNPFAAAKKTRTFSTSSASSSSSNSKVNVENEIPTGRKVGGGFQRPTNVQRAALSLPTFTVGQNSYENEQPNSFNQDASEVQEPEVVFKDPKSVESSSSSSSRQMVPVFQRPASSETKTKSYNSYARTQKGQPGSFRHPKSGTTFSDSNEVDHNEAYDLQSAATTGRATVTYVGFADFTTTVGNTVIVFMPRTRMIEDLSIHASKTVASPTVIAPTKYPTASTSEIVRITSTTTEKQPELDDDDDEPAAITTTRPRKVVQEAEKAKESSTFTVSRGRKKDSTPKYVGSSASPTLSSSVAIKPSSAISETTIVFSGRQTIFTNLDHHNSKILQQQSGVQTRVVSGSSISLVEPTPVAPSATITSISPSEKRNSLFPPRPKFTPKLAVSKSVVPEPSPTFSESKISSSPVVSRNGHSTTATTSIYQTDVVSPTGLVTSIGGSIVHDSTTTLFTSLVYGTFIGEKYAQIIKSTSTVFFLIPSKTVSAEESSSAVSSLFTPPSPAYSTIRPTPAAKFSGDKTKSVFSYEVSTTESNDENAESTTSGSAGGDYDRAEVSVTTTESAASTSNSIDNSIETTTILEDSESKSTTPKDLVDPYELQNEIEGRKVAGGSPKGQIITDSDDKVDVSPSVEAPEEDQTIFVTRTLPTTVYRTYTYYTTFFIPKDNDETVTSVISREITSTAVGFVKKTFSNILPTASLSPSSEASADADSLLKPIGEEIISPSSSQVIYKTFFTTYTYVTTFFTGQTTSLASREEIVSNVVTLTQLIEDAPSQSESITPTSSASVIEPTKTKSYVSPSRSVSSSKESSSEASRSGKYSVGKKFRSSSVLPRSPLFEESDSVSTPSPTVSSVEPELSSTLIPSVVEQTILKTFFTSLTYFTTLFNGVNASTKTRTEVITNIVPTTTRSTIFVPTATIEPSPIVVEDEASRKHNVGETTFYTTYTYLSSIFKDGTTYHKSSLDTYTNVVAEGSTIRSGIVKKSSVVPAVEPTKIAGRTAAASKKPFGKVDDVDADDLNEVGSHLSEMSETTVASNDDDQKVTTIETPKDNFYELEGSEMTTEKSIYNEHEHFDEHEKKNAEDDEDEDREEDENEIVRATPALKTYFTTFTFFTTFYKHGTSMVSSRLETVTNIASETVHDHEGASSTDTPNQGVLPVYPITYFTTYTYWTTSFKDKTPVVTSREETVSNIVTPGIDDIVVAPSKTVAALESEIEPTITYAAREAKQNNDISADLEPTEIFAEVELTTYFTTYTYYTTSYLGDDTIVNSRFETVTNLITGTIEPTQVDSASSASTATSDQTPRAVGTGPKPTEQLLVDPTTPTEEDDDDLPIGLLSTVVNTEVHDLTTTIFSTDVFGTYIDGIYAQVLESTSKIVVAPTKASSSVFGGAETSYMPEASSTPTGLLILNEGKTLEGENNNTIIFYKTKTYGTIIDNTYAHLIKSTSTVQVNSEDTDAAHNQFKTGIIRIVDGAIVENDRTTTFYTTSVVGKIIENQYAQILESTSRVIINPTKTDELTTVQPTGIVDIESSEDALETTEEIPATTEGNAEENDDSAAKDNVSSKRFLGRGRDRSSRISFTPPGSKSFTPFITPFSSRSRAAFAPKRKQTAAVIVTRTDVTPTVTATLAPASSTSSRVLPSSRGNSFQNRQRFRRPEESSDTGTTPGSITAPTPRLPSTGRTRFQRPRPGGSATDTAAEVVIEPTSTSGVTGSSPGGRGSARGGSSAKVSSSGFSRRGTSTFPSRGSASFSVSSSGVRGTGASSSRYNVRGRGTISPTRSVTTGKPTAVPEDDEYEIIEYEYENNAPPLGTSSTTEKSTTSNSRFGGNNRFRLNPRLPVSNLAVTTATPATTTTQRTTGNLPFLKKRTFTRPTQASTSDSESLSDTVAAVVDSVEEILGAGLPSESTSSTTVKPKIGLKNLIKPVGRTSSGSTNRAVTTTTSTTPAPKTTTRRAFAPRSRPLGFPSKALVRPTTGTTTKAEGDNSDDELELEESKNLPGDLSSAILSEAGSQSIPVIAAMSDMRDVDLQNDESVQVEHVIKHNPGEKTFEGDIVHVPYLVDSGAQFFEDVAPSPYESYEYYSDDINSSNNDTETSEVGRKRGQILKRSVRQVLDYNYDDSNNDYTFGQRKRSTLRSKFRPSNYNARSTNSRSVSSVNPDYDETEYYYDETPVPPPSPPTTTTTTTTPAPRNRYRGRISPTTSTSRQTPFTLTNPNTRTSSFANNARSTSNGSPSYARRSQSRYVRPTADFITSTTTQRPSTSRFRSRYRTETLTTTRPSNTRNRYLSPSRNRGTSSSLGSSNIRGGSLYNSDDRFTSIDDSRAKEAVELGTLTVTHYIPAETTIPVINGKNTEYKTILTPSASVEIIAPYQYTYSDYQGKSVLILNSELSSTPSFGVTEVTKYVLRESPTTSVTFTPTTIRGRKTSFSHIVPSTVYSVEPIVSTITTNPLADNNQLTNLLLNQLLGNLNLNQNGLLNNFQQQQQQQHQFQQQMLAAMGEPQTPITQFNTKTTTYVTTVTDFTSTVIPITLHGKVKKTTLVESSTNVITATEFITESTVVTPTQQLAYIPQQQTQLLGQQQLNGLNPALLQGLFQQQQALVLQQQQQALIQPTQAAQLVAPTARSVDSSEGTPSESRIKEDKQKVEEQPKYSIVTLYVSGRNPGEFSTVLSTVPFETDRVKRSIASASNSKIPSSGNELYNGEFTKVDFKVVPTDTYVGNEEKVPFDYSFEEHGNYDIVDDRFGLYLDDSYSFSDILGSTLVNNHYNKNTADLTNEQLLQATQSLESVLNN